MLHLSEYVAESTLHVFFSVSQCLWESPTPTRRVTAGDVVTYKRCYKSCFTWVRWRSFKTISRLRIAWGAICSRRRYGSSAVGARRIQTRGGFLGLKHPKHKKQVIFPKSAKGLYITNVTSKYGEALAKELAAYYEPVPCESKMPSDIEDVTKRKLIQRERRKRWEKRKRNKWWTPHVPRAGQLENTEW